MDFGKVNQKTTKKALVMGTGVVAGSVVSDVVADKIPEKNRLYGRIALAVGGLAIASLVTGNTTQADATRGFGFGMAAMQGTKAARVGLEKILPEEVKQTEEGRSALGLGCGCESSYNRMEGRALAQAFVPQIDYSMPETRTQGELVIG